MKQRSLTNNNQKKQQPKTNPETKTKQRSQKSQNKQNNETRNKINNVQKRGSKKLYFDRTKNYLGLKGEDVLIRIVHSNGRTKVVGRPIESWQNFNYATRDCWTKKKHSRRHCQKRRWIACHFCSRTFQHRPIGTFTSDNPDAPIATESAKLRNRRAEHFFVRAEQPSPRPSRRHAKNFIYSKIRVPFCTLSCFLIRSLVSDQRTFLVPTCASGTDCLNRSSTHRRWQNFCPSEATHRSNLT